MPPIQNTQSKRIWTEENLLDLFPAELPKKDDIPAVNSRIKDAIAQITNTPANGALSVDLILPYYLKVADQLPDDLKANDYALLKVLLQNFCTNPVQAFWFGVYNFQAISAKAFSSGIKSPQADSDNAHASTITSGNETHESAKRATKAAKSSGSTEEIKTSLVKTGTLLLKRQAHKIRLAERLTQTREEISQIEGEIKELGEEQNRLNVERARLRRQRSEMLRSTSNIRADIKKIRRKIGNDACDA